MNTGGMDKHYCLSSVRPALGSVNGRVENWKFDGNPSSDYRAVIIKMVGCCDMTAMGLNDLARNAESKTRVGAKCLTVRPSRVEALKHSVFMFVGKTWAPIIADDLYRTFSSA